MSTLNFPTSPSLNDTYTFGAKTWIWNGAAWQIQTQGAINNTPIGNVAPSTGAFTVVSVSGNVSAQNFIGNGAALTGITATAAPAGNSGDVQFNNAGTTGGSANFTFDGENVTVAGNISANGNISGDYFIGNGSLLTGIDATGIQNGTSNVRVVDVDGNVAVSINGTSNIALISSTGLVVTGSIEATNGFIGLDATAIANGSANVRTFANANVTVSAEGNANVLIVTGNGVNLSGNLTVTGNAGVGNLTATTVAATDLTGTLITAAQPNITSVGTLSALAVTGNISGGNLITSGAVTGNGRALTSLNASNLDTGTVSTSRISGSYTGITGVGTLSAGTWQANSISTTYTDAKVTSVNASTGVSVDATTGAVTITNTGVTSAVAGTGVSVSGATGAVTFSIGQAVGTGNSPTFAGLTLPAITKNGSNGVGNIGQSNNTFNTVFARATSALYADLAELYTTDQEYAPGTVLVFGGVAEVTESTHNHCTKIAGVVSTEPAHIMNSALTAEHVAAVALVGRVPCRVVGQIQPGDCLVSSDIPGVATAMNAAKYQPGVVIGKALEDYNRTEPGVIEVVVGRL